MQAARQEDADPRDEAWRSPLDELERTVSELGKAISSLRRSLEIPAREQARPQVEIVERSTLTEPEAAPPAPKMGVVESVEPFEIDEPKAETGAAGFKDVWDRLERERQEAEQGASSPEPPDTPAPEIHALDEGTGSESAEPVAEDEEDIAAEASGFKDVWERLQRERQERDEGGDEKDLTSLRGLGQLPQDYRITIEDRDGTPVDLVPIHRALLTFAQPADVSLMSFANGVPVVSVRTDSELDLDALGATIGTATSRQCEVIQQERGKLFLRLSTEEGNKA